MGQETSSQASLDFIDSSGLTYFIPQPTNFRLEDEFKDNEDEKSYEDRFKAIEGRDSLFFGRRNSSTAIESSLLTVLIPRPQMNLSMSTSSCEHPMSRKTR